jgi:hypothetical protein
MPSGIVRRTAVLGKGRPAELLSAFTLENAMSRCVRSLLASLLLVSLARGGSLSRTPNGWVYGADGLSVALAADTGAWRELRLDGHALTRDGGASSPCRLKEQNRWLPDADHPAKLESVRQTADNTVVTTVTFADWEVRIEYALFPAKSRIRRRATILWHGQKETKLKGFALPGPTFAVDAQAQWFFPGTWPPARRHASEFVPGTRRSYHASPVPLVFQYAAGKTLLCAHDQLRPDSDSGSVTVEEREQGVGVSQAFNALARMKPETEQAVGDAWFWLVDANADQALLKFHDLLRDFGFVPPANRPEWLDSAILYSFHPGGTIGSGFHDLGGFVPATKYPDRIADLGCNAIWILPVEDRAPYHPRDYYKFQQGLGTPEEYRALVARAHELGLHVLQDIVPHGGSNTYPRAKAHPEWLVQEEDGSTLSYWCFDFNWPEWCNYMGDVARYYVREYGVDGYRVDACAGSKIPNWNPDIPYARASFAKLQGGLNMLRSLRSAVKEIKPKQGAILAESGSNASGTVSDVIYDFDFCYRVLHDLRKRPAADFVTDLRQWLHEQAAAGPPGQLRLRHIESHDSLRSQLWYGLEPQRALMALSAFIPGVPLVYDECEDGSRQEFQTIFRLRRQFPELNGGTADYLRVPTPPGVFACLRSKDGNRCLVLINFNPTTATFADGESDIDLPPFAYRILRRGGIYPKTVTKPKETPSALQATATGPHTVACGDLFLDVDPVTGLPRMASQRGRQVTAAWDLYLPADCRPAGPAKLQSTDRGLASQRTYGDSTLRVLYTPTGLETQWDGPVPTGAALAIPIVEGKTWQATAAEGVFADDYVIRHPVSNGYASSIYWHRQGTDVIWDSLLHPLPVDRVGGIGAGGAGGGLSLWFQTPPPRVRWFEQLPESKHLTAVLAWDDSQSPAPTASQLAFSVAVYASSRRAQGARFIPTTGGWRLLGAPYQLRLAKEGTITSLGDTTGEELIHLSDLYTDAGFLPERKRYGACNDVEAYSHLAKTPTGLQASFRGRLRGSYRFDRHGPPIDYAADYQFVAGSSFRLRYAVQPTGNASGKRAFLALYLPTPDLKTFRFEKDGKVIAEGDTGDGSKRAFQTSEMAKPVVPERIVIGDGSRTLYQLTDIRCGKGHIDNVFVHGHNFFITFLDTEEPPSVAGKWRWVEAVVTPGDAAPAAVPPLPPFEAGSAATELLRDGSFEVSANQPVSLLNQTMLPGQSGASHWQAPVGGSLVTHPVHQGRFAVAVEGKRGNYRLWNQSLPTDRFPAGSKWQLSGWMKGKDVKAGDISWQVPTLRFAVGTDKTQYVAAQPPVGTFDWRQVRVEWTVPAGLKALSIQAGQNGSSGTLWLDDIKLKRVD